MTGSGDGERGGRWLSPERVDTIRVVHSFQRVLIEAESPELGSLGGCYRD
jgi:hypothetical protein